MTFQTQIITLYPEMFPGPLGTSLAGRALSEGKWACSPIQLRDFAGDKHRTVDDTPAGGGAGMVLKADVLARAVAFAVGEMTQKLRLPEPVEGPSFLHAREGEKDSPSTSSGKRDGVHSSNAPIIALTPRGTPITQGRIREIAAGPGVTLICGRFEGFDERFFDAHPEIEQVSVGDIILSGGEPAALMILDACIRLLPGVMGASCSGVEESFEDGLLEYPHYTRPQMWEGRMIPEVLRSGDHAKIEAWRKSQSEIDTRLRRPDLWERHIGTRVQPAYDARRKNKD
jgi:tRNA (guanine37-N1)-methyltransferase